MKYKTIEFNKDIAPTLSKTKKQGKYLVIWSDYDTGYRYEFFNNKKELLKGCKYPMKVDEIIEIKNQLKIKRTETRILK